MTFNKRRQINAASETQRRGAYTSKNGNKDYKVRLRWLWGRLWKGKRSGYS